MAVTRWLKQTIANYLLALVLVVSGPLAQAQPQQELNAWTRQGVVTRVYDGDTLTLLTLDRGLIRVRLLGVDAPERGQAYSRRATDYLRKLVTARQVTAHCIKTDRYQRELCELQVDNQDVGLSMIQAGYAWHFKRYQDDQSPEQRDSYALAEVAAREAKKGLQNANGGAMPPWECRANKRKGEQCR